MPPPGGGGRARVLNGLWHLRGSHDGPDEIRDGKIYGQDGYVVDIHFDGGPRSDSFYVLLDGERNEARYVNGEIHWDDGDIWIRAGCLDGAFHANAELAPHMRPREKAGVVPHRGFAGDVATGPSKPATATKLPQSAVAGVLSRAAIAWMRVVLGVSSTRTADSVKVILGDRLRLADATVVKWSALVSMLREVHNRRYTSWYTQALHAASERKLRSVEAEVRQARGKELVRMEREAQQAAAARAIQSWGRLLSRAFHAMVTGEREESSRMLVRRVSLTVADLQRRRTEAVQEAEHRRIMADASVDELRRLLEDAYERENTQRRQLEALQDQLQVARLQQSHKTDEASVSALQAAAATARGESAQLRAQAADSRAELERLRADVNAGDAEKAQAVNSATAALHAEFKARVEALTSGHAAEMRAKASSSEERLRHAVREARSLAAAQVRECRSEVASTVEALRQQVATLAQMVAPAGAPPARSQGAAGPPEPLPPASPPRSPRAAAAGRPMLDRGIALAPLDGQCSGCSSPRELAAGPSAFGAPCHPEPEPEGNARTTPPGAAGIAFKSSAHALGGGVCGGDVARRSRDGWEVAGRWARLCLLSSLAAPEAVGREAGFREAAARLKQRCATVRAQAEAAEQRVLTHARHAMSLQQMMQSQARSRLAACPKLGRRDRMQSALEEQANDLLEKSFQLLKPEAHSWSICDSEGAGGIAERFSVRSVPRLPVSPLSAKALDDAAGPLWS